MKKNVLLIVFLICAAGCTLEDEGTTYSSELVPVTTVEIPDTLVFRNHYTFKISYQRPTDCYFFDGFSYEQNANEFLFAVVNGVYENPHCEPVESDTTTVNLNFAVNRNDFYIFKFWQGKDANGEPIFLTKEVPVTTH